MPENAKLWLNFYSSWKCFQETQSFSSKKTQPRRSVSKSPEFQKRKPSISYPLLSPKSKNSSPKRSMQQNKINNENIFKNEANFEQTNQHEVKKKQNTTQGIWCKEDLHR